MSKLIEAVEAMKVKDPLGRDHPLADGRNNLLEEVVALIRQHKAQGLDEASLPVIREFSITRVGGENVIAEGNEWFCHAHEVKAYRDAVRPYLRTLQPALQDDRTADLAYRAGCHATKSEALQVSAEVLRTIRYWANAGAESSSLANSKLYAANARNHADNALIAMQEAMQ